MNRIMLITTKGCEGCTIARNSIKDAISQTKKSISFEEIDVNEVNKKFLKTFDIEDFPAILFFKDKKLKFKRIGSVPSIVILRWIDINFNQIVSFFWIITRDVGVSNTAGTLYYFIVMRSKTFIYCIIVAATIIVTKFVIEKSSAPVEEMYHRQLVNTLDSILDARFDPGCCEEVIDSNDVTIIKTRFSDSLSPMD